ncbi:unnamed protein product, partial [Choristocarpus tenellus]
EERQHRKEFYGYYTKKMLTTTWTYRDDEDVEHCESVASTNYELRREWRKWVGDFNSVPGAKARLFCFPHAGGNSASYSRWHPYLPGVEVVPIMLPGRLMRAAEKPLNNISDLVIMVFNALHGLQLLSHDCLPFSLFGHELGAIIAFELCRLIHCDFPPQALFVSGMCGPQVRHFNWKK